MNGEPRKMTEVYFIPKLRSNIIILGQETESGCDIRLKGENLTMHDWNGKILVKSNRSKTGSTKFICEQETSQRNK